MLRIITAMCLALLSVTPAHAAVLSFSFGTPGQTGGTITYDTVLSGPGFAPDSRRIGATFSSLFLEGREVVAGSLRGSISQAIGTAGEQTLIFNQFFTSPFFPRPDYTAGFTLEFQANDGALFSTDGIVAAPGTLAGYFVSGTVNPQPGQVVQFGLSVPEPATWGLMIFGLGGIGVSLRRRRVQLLTA